VAGHLLNKSRNRLKLDRARKLMHVSCNSSAGMKGVDEEVRLTYPDLEREASEQQQGQEGEEEEKQQGSQLRHSQPPSAPGIRCVTILLTWKPCDQPVLH
jgi:hypothetical protein